ncbi:hypothetical protein HGRIS_012786 [Hohenbuehelia grisea]|uniref:Uncharacterized protein n=1 Tax=Hohenbuehelia grisea TaxID=104357 RepID=A0ABR3ITD7_9AGAR
MFSILAQAAIAFLAVSSVDALVVPRKASPPGWATNYLEPYEVYHTRYLALQCHKQHKSAFFDDCCHPLLATETLLTARKPYCTPSPSASSSAHLAEPTSTVKTPADDGEDCEDDDDFFSDEDDCSDDDDNSDAPSTPAPQPAPTPAPATPKAPTQAPAPAPPPKAPEAPKPEPAKPAPAPPAPTPKAPEPAPSPKPDGGITGIIGDLIGGGLYVHQSSCFISHG